MKRPGELFFRGGAGGGGEFHITSSEWWGGIASYYLNSNPGEFKAASKVLFEGCLSLVDWTAGVEIYGFRHRKQAVFYANLSSLF
jgi:hypothetical protein